MSLEQTIIDGLKDAMKSKNEVALRTMRAIKAEIIKAKTEPGAGGVLTPEKEIPLLQKMVKQRKDAAEIYATQGRPDLQKTEEEELAIIQQYLPQQLSAEQLNAELKTIITEVGAASPADMGKVMGIATKKLAGRADGKQISAAVKALLQG